MVTRDQATRASGAPVEPADQELVRSTMQEFDTDANEGSRLLLSGPAGHRRRWTTSAVGGGAVRAADGDASRRSRRRTRPTSRSRCSTGCSARPRRARRRATRPSGRAPTVVDGDPADDPAETGLTLRSRRRGAEPPEPRTTARGAGTTTTPTATGRRRDDHGDALGLVRTTIRREPGRRRTAATPAARAGPAAGTRPGPTTVSVPLPLPAPVDGAVRRAGPARRVARRLTQATGPVTHAWTGRRDTTAAARSRACSAPPLRGRGPAPDRRRAATLGWRHVCGRGGGRGGRHWWETESGVVPRSRASRSRRACSTP